MKIQTFQQCKLTVTGPGNASEEKIREFTKASQPLQVYRNSIKRFFYLWVFHGTITLGLVVKVEVFSLMSLKSPRQSNQ